MNRRKICTAILTIALCAAMTAPAYAAQNPYAHLEAKSRQAVEVAVKAGTVPPGTSIYDCEYGADKNGVTIVIRYRDKSGGWIDVVTQKKADNMPADTVSPSNRPTEKQLEEYALEVFRLANKERQKAGLDEVSWDDDFTACARIRAEELQYRYSHYRPVEPAAGAQNGLCLHTAKKEYTTVRALPTNKASPTLGYGKTSWQSAPRRSLP